MKKVQGPPQLLGEIYVAGTRAALYYEVVEQVTLQPKENLITIRRETGQAFAAKEHPELLFPIQVFESARIELLRCLRSLEIRAKAAKRKKR